VPSVVIIAIAGLAVAGAGVALYIALRGGDDESKAKFVPGQTAPDQEGAAASRVAEDNDPSPLLTSSLNKLGIRRRLQWHLLQAGLLVRPSELLALMLGTAAVGFIVGMFTQGLALALALTIVAGGLPMLYVNVRKARRRKALGNQLAEALSMMASSLRSGYSFLRAMQIVKDEMDPPIAEEFGRVLDELNVGVSHERALQHLYDRCPTGDIELVVTACQIQSNVGGNLAQILDTTAEMIRERVRLQGEIAALTAEGRLSAGILAALPIFLAVIVDYLSPGYLEPLFTTQPGLIMFGGASMAMFVGLLLIKKMLAIQI